jgi:nitroreductase
VPKEIISGALKTAQRAASWCNSQAWQLSVTSGDATARLREALSSATAADRSSDFPFPQEYTGAYQLRRQESGRQLYDAVGIARGDKEAYGRQTRENFRFFGAPHVAILTSDPGLGTYGAVDVGGYVQILLLALQAQGVSAIAQAALAVYSPIVKRTLNIPSERLMVCGISFGFEDVDHPVNGFRTNRADLADVVDWLER